EDDDIEQVARQMGEKQLHRMVVVSRGSNGIRGILSLGDLSAMSDSRKIVGAVLAECTSS
ncbi:MAG: CBS domain-containing protein, partial [Candidatus Latescibacterota bacterium]